MILHLFFASMQYYVVKDGQKCGPYLEEEVRQRMISGEFSGVELVWREGLPGWVPLPQILSGPIPASALTGMVPPMPPPLEIKSSGLAKATFIIGTVVLVLWLILVVIAGVFSASGVKETDPRMMVLGLCMFAGVGVNILGAVLGFVALKMGANPKWMTVTGMVLNLIEILGIAALIMIGLIIK